MGIDFDLELSPSLDDNEQFRSLWGMVEDDATPIIILTGSAGTGKTTMVRHLVGRLREKEWGFRLLATTGRAATILAGRTGAGADTIHGTLYVFKGLNGSDALKDDEREIEDGDAGKLYVDFGLRDPKIERNRPRIFIVDEASMLSHHPPDKDHTAQFGNGNLLDDLMAYADGCKVLFIGDPCQLPPVSIDHFSPALSADFLAQRYDRKVGLVRLERVWRQSEGNEILEAAVELRNAIVQKRTHKGIGLMPAQGRQVHRMPNLENLLDAYVGQILTGDEAASAIMIAHSNTMVHQLNMRLRAKAGYGQDLRPGEILSVVQNSQTVNLTNGDLVRVLSVSYDSDRAGFRFLQVKVRKLHGKDEIDTLMIQNLLHDTSPTLRRQQVGQLMIDYDKRMRKLGHGRKSHTYLEELKTDPYLNALRCKFGYVVTCHKAQGGEWDDVYLALNGSVYYLPPEVAARWYYTAITRAKKSLYVNSGPWMAYQVMHFL